MSIAETSTERQYRDRQRARRRCVQALYQWQVTADSALELISQFRRLQNFEGVDIGYFQALVKGVIAHVEQLDEQLNRHLDRTILTVDLTERAILRLAVYELMFVPEIPYKVVLDEAVELAHRFGAEQGHAYVNGVLDKTARDLRKAEVEPE